MTTYYDLTGFQRDCLRAIAAIDGHPHGLALKAWLDERYSEVINHSRLYHNLHHLDTEEGLVIVTERTEDDGRRNAYALTEAGTRLVEAHADEVARQHVEDTLVTDGGVAGEYAIDPFVCPRGHHSITLNATRFSCQTCYEGGHEPSNWDKAALVDLRESDPPGADSPEDDRGRPITDGGPKDVLITAGAEEVAGKWVDCIGPEAEAYWRVSGQPRHSAPGQYVWFTREGRDIFAFGVITALEPDRLWFDAAHPVDIPCLDAAPTQGFASIEPLVGRLEAHTELPDPLTGGELR